MGVGKNALSNKKNAVLRDVVSKKHCSCELSAFSVFSMFRWKEVQLAVRNQKGHFSPFNRDRRDITDIPGKYC